MEQQHYDLPAPKNFSGKTLKVISRELKGLGYNGGAQTAAGAFIYISRMGGRIEVTPPKNKDSEGIVRVYDSAIREEVSGILERIGGRV